MTTSTTLQAPIRLQDSAHDSIVGSKKALFSTIILLVWQGQPCGGGVVGHSGDWHGGQWQGHISCFGVTCLQAFPKTCLSAILCKPKPLLLLVSGFLICPYKSVTAEQQKR